MKSFAGFALVLIIFFSGCKKENTTPLDFSKITVADVYCVYISDIDSSDWISDDVWSTQETNLLKFTDTLTLTDSTTGYVQLSAPCPNPSEGLFIMGINTERQCKMKLVCVNTDMQVLFYTARKFTGGPIATAYDFRSNTGFHKNENYRFYYGFYSATDSLYYKGHGDFRLE